VSTFHCGYDIGMDRSVPPHPTRRVALAMLGAAGATLTGAPAFACAVSPQIEEGPFFVDERLNRSDLTGGTGRPGVVEGVPLRLTLSVVTVRGSTCEPLAGAQVDLWQADAGGLYSDEAVLHTRGERFLRGYQTSDAVGTVSFTTVYPGWYPGRAPHVHVKVRSYSPQGNVTQAFTSQLYFDAAVSNAVFARGLYAARGSLDTPNARDQLFDRRMIVPLQRTERGYAGTFTFAMRTSA
jgi:protocatechuate 3,4-dioxygenase beta subunit